MKYAGLPAGMWLLFSGSFYKHLITVLGYDVEMAKTVTAKLKLYEYVPAMCRLDYAMSEAGGVSEFVRKYTLASGGPYCDCGYKKSWILFPDVMRSSTDGLQNSHSEIISRPAKLCFGRRRAL